MSAKLDTLIEDVREIAALLRREPRVSARLQAAVDRASGHAKEAEQWKAAAAPVQRSLFGGPSPVTPRSIPSGKHENSASASRSVARSRSDVSYKIRVMLMASERLISSDDVEEWLQSRDAKEGKPPRSYHQSISPRFTELRDAGIIVACGKGRTRMGEVCDKYRLTPKGAEALEAWRAKR